MTPTRRGFLKSATAAAAFPAAIERALAIPANRRTGTIKDVKHIVILMQENRSFDHYFGTLRGVRGFGDRHPVPLASGKDVWWQHNGARELPPFHLDTARTNALKVPGTPHSFADAQAAWNQGKFGLWPKFKTDYAMGYYRREDVPFQFALAEAFTICDAYHCSVTSGTDPNRVVFWSGSGFDPGERARGVNCRDDKSEPDNLRCWIKGALPEPGYTYAGNALEWKTIPDVLEEAGIDWRIYQDPNDNWTGAMHGGLAFRSFRECRPGSALYEKGMSHHSLEKLAADVKAGTLPAVSWVLPPMPWSEHPSTSSPAEGAEFTSRVLDALTANPDVWGSTVVFLTFDENDGQFDHLPPPAPPSYNPDGSLAGKATIDLAGHYFDDHADRHRSRDDATSGALRPWGLGPRVPMYVISPWSRGGWVNSQVFDHTSVGRFLEQRFAVTIPAISPWHRAVCGDLTTCFDFRLAADGVPPVLPDAAGSVALVREHQKRPKILPPRTVEGLFQETGQRPSRALPYVLHADALIDESAREVKLLFANGGTQGAVFHVYDRKHLDRIPRRYTVEAGKLLSDTWQLEPDFSFDLWVLGPNGFLRHVHGQGSARGAKVVARYDTRARALRLQLTAGELDRVAFRISNDPYGANSAIDLTVPAAGATEHLWRVGTSHDWYDVSLKAGDVTWRMAGRLERNAHGLSDPLMAAHLS